MARNLVVVNNSGILTVREMNVYVRSDLELPEVGELVYLEVGDMVLETSVMAVDEQAHTYMVKAEA